MLQRQHVAKAYAGAADAGAAGNSAATNQPQRLMQPLPSSSVYSVPLLCWSPGGVLLEQLLPRLLECPQRASVVLVTWRVAVRAAPVATARVSTLQHAAVVLIVRSYKDGLSRARADPAANC